MGVVNTAPGVYRILGTGSSTALTGNVRIRGYNLHHSAAASLSIASGVTGTNTVLRARTTTSDLSQVVMFPKGQEIVCPGGCYVSAMTANACLYLFT